MERLVRPRTREEAEQFARDLGAALERLGVERGQGFVVSTEKALGDIDTPTEGKARTGDPATSKEAAKGVLPKSNTQRRQLLDAIASAGFLGMTAEEAALATGIPYRSATPRIGELKEAGWIEANGQRRTTSMNAEAEILVMTTQALDALGEANKLFQMQQRGPDSALIGS